MRNLFLLVAIVGVTACEGSRAETMKQMAEMQTIAAQKDSLLKDVTATSVFLADLSKQVSTVRNLKSGRNAANSSDLEDNLTPAQRRERMLAQVQEITNRLNIAENRLAVARRRVTELTGSDAEKSKRLADFDSTVASYKLLFENQREQIASLTEQVNALAAENAVLREDNGKLVTRTVELTSERDSVTTEHNTVYYVVASQKALLERHLVEKSGGFLGFGKTPVASRDLDPMQFTPGDMRQLTEIPLPDTTKTYRIVSRQDLSALATPADRGGRVKGAIRIRDPQMFWAASRYLIVVAQ
ncbi:MAG: hypothetical protein H3C62_00845 [Gemmatimonadaceae bacterium]|nr:hypothetical protein [Gemmatimonadaceae bacterium]